MKTLPRIHPSGEYFFFGLDDSLHFWLYLAFFCLISDLNAFNSKRLHLEEIGKMEWENWWDGEIFSPDALFMGYSGSNPINKLQCLFSKYTKVSRNMEDLCVTEVLLKCFGAIWYEGAILSLCQWLIIISSLIWGGNKHYSVYSSTKAN